MRICQITTMHPIDDVRVFYRQCSTLAEKGYEVHLVMTTESQVKNGVTIHGIPRIDNPLLRMIILPWPAAYKALATRADIYHYHEPELIIMGFVLRWVFGKRTVFDAHEAIRHLLWTKEWLPRLLRRPIAWLYSIIEHPLLSGQEIILANEGCLPDYPARATLVRNFPIYRVPSQPGREWSEGRDNPPLIIYVGKVWLERGAIRYLQLARGLKDRGISFHMMIVGPFPSKAFHRQMMQYHRELGLEDCVELPGLILNAQAMDLVGRASIGLCLLDPKPNYKYNLATKIVEYMMMGTPVLASDFDNWRSYVEGEKSGRMVDPLDLEAVIETCAEMLANPKELAEMGQRGSVAVRDRYIWDTELATLERLYLQMMQSRP